MMQTLDQLQASGAPIDQARVHLMGDFSPQTGYDASKEVTAAVGEFRDTGGSRAELLKRHAVLGDLKKTFDIGIQDSGPLQGIEVEPPDSEEIGAAQKEAFTKLGRRNPFNTSFRVAKGIEAAGPQIEGQQPLRYDEYMKRAKGREAKPKVKGAFSFSTPAPSIAPALTPSVPLAPASSAAYDTQPENTPSIALPAEASSVGPAYTYVPSVLQQAAPTAAPSTADVIYQTRPEDEMY
jgi:hypothetical protein